MFEEIKQRFLETYSKEAQYVFSAPGRTEIGGNHTDHQLGRVLAGAVSLDTLAAVAPNGEAGDPGPVRGLLPSVRSIWRIWPSVPPRPAPPPH